MCLFILSPPLGDAIRQTGNELSHWRVWWVLRLFARFSLLAWMAWLGDRIIRWHGLLSVALVVVKEEKDRRV